MTLADLIESGAVKPGQALFGSHKKHDLRASITKTGGVRFDGTDHPSPSAAALAAITSAGGRESKSERIAVNGWTFWHVAGGATLGSLRGVREVVVEESAGPRLASPEVEAKRARIRKASATVDAIEGLPGPEYVVAIGSAEAQDALETLAEASIGAERQDISE
jgi:hypothetical protein